MHSPALAHEQPDDLPGALEGLLRELDHSGCADATIAAGLLENLDLQVADLQPWQDIDHSLCDSYGRQLVARGSNYELMVMSWAPGDYSAIHDHGLAEWGAVRYFGVADHLVFAERSGCLTLDQRMSMRPGDVFPVEPELIHAMGNGTDFPFLSLHLYGRADAADSITGSARVFDLFEQRIQRTDGGVFFCLPERDIVSRQACPTADRSTTMLHHELMLARIERNLASGCAGAAWADRAASLRASILQLAARD